ncbi:MAG: hypothetical protein PVF73_04905 [Bacteroidales bacterium]|jgi:hypothetical protein
MLYRIPSISLIALMPGGTSFFLDKKEAKNQEEIMLLPALVNSNKNHKTRMPSTFWIFLAIAHSLLLWPAISSGLRAGKDKFYEIKLE